MRAEKGRFAFSVAGVAVSSLLLAFILALYSGWNESIASYVEDVPADVWVAQKGNESFFSASFVAESSLEEIRATEGVSDVTSMLGRSLKIRKGNDSWDSYVVGFEAGSIGGPIKVKDGTREISNGEIIIDDVLARTAGIDLGDAIVVGEAELRVAGISTGGNQVIYQLSFVTMEQARELVGLTGVVNFALVRTEPDRTESVVSAINGSIPGVTAFEAGEFAKSSRKVLQRSMLPILSVVVVLVFAVGAVVVGLTIYTATVEKEREFGVMKALGTPNRKLAETVVQQSLICGVLGFVIGEVLVVGASSFAQRLVPQFVTLLRWQDVLIVFVSVAVMATLASYLPLQRVMRVDPLRVFKA